MESSTSSCVDCPTDDYLNVTDTMPYYDTTNHDNMLLQTVASMFHKYVTPTDVFVGLVANIVSILVFAGKELRKLSSSVYVLSVLSADTGLLLTMSFQWLETLGYKFTHKPGICQLYVYFQYCFSFLSVWFMVCITVENYITICHPMRIRTLCTLTRARGVVISLLVSALLIYMFYIFSTHVATNSYTGIPMCQTKPSWGTFMTIITLIDTVLTLLLPFLAMMFMLVAIVCAIVTSLRKRRKRTTRESQRSSSCPQVRVAKMLFALSLTYLLLNIPVHSVRLYALTVQILGYTQNSSIFLSFILLIFEQVSYINFYIKFFLFFAFSANFRKGVFGGGCRRCQVYAPVSQTTEGTKV
ncbi:thyrotropin-releasing hormone receptor-like [Haliotis rufescens]|uniref:thyrotropin-releasing hormone receptor-like n=1 Tax=Haliotis rufescens TaxID=6454 RepID=UPI00201E8021|nr:thyrotropin-releasing hormone receptor-like [Haliotis rufescens]